jgi:integrase
MSNTTSLNKFYLSGKSVNALMYNAEGERFIPFEKYTKHLKSKGYSSNTIVSYGGHVFRFINYLYKAADLTEGALDRDRIEDIISSYSSYLIHGQQSSNELSCQIAIDNEKINTTSYSSLLPIDASLTYFIKLFELKQLGTSDDLLNSFLNTTTRYLSSFEKKNIHKNSMLAGVISHSLVNDEKSRMGVLSFSRRKGKKVLHATRSFDLDKVIHLIDSASNLRDKALYALLAASGCRTHEALQITIDDINPKTQEVILRSYEDDKRKLQGLTNEEIGKLSWKGRNTEQTFLIEPFKSLFFKYISEYMKKERNCIAGHRFIFQNYKTKRPHFCSDRSSRIKQFKQAATKAGVEDLYGISPHSLRHMYGFYVLNYLQLSDGKYGLSAPVVKVLMGHASFSSTELYAKHDTDFILAQIDFANKSLFGKALSIKELKKQYHTSELAKLEELESL